MRVGVMVRVRVRVMVRVWARVGARAGARAGARVRVRVRVSQLLLLLRELRGVEVLQIARDRLLDDLALHEYAHHEELLLLAPSTQRLDGG